MRSWLLRRAMGRFRITDDIVRHLSTFQRLGENLEVDLPGELVPVGARTVFRAIRTRAAAQLGPEWIWPYWLERQLDPRSPAFIPRGHLPLLTNVTSRNWTMVGNVGSSREAIVDPRGLVTPWFDGWSLDWWVGAEDRWHFPSRQGSVRQRLVESSPVVETAMRVPGGDIVQRVYAAPAMSGSGRQLGELVIVEVENQTPTPVALAFAVRPSNPEGLAVVERIDLQGRTVLVDGRPALLLPRPPSRAAASTFEAGDVAGVVESGAAGDRFPTGVRCEVGLASAAFLFPVAHRTTIRVAMPLQPGPRVRRKAPRRREELPVDFAALPTSAAVVRGWAAQTDRGMRLVLPPGRLADAVEANRRFMLLFHDGTEVTPGPYTYHRFWFRDAAFMLLALDRFGFHREVAEVLRSYPARQHADGFFLSQRQEWDANGAALFALAEHWRLTSDEALAVDLAPAVARAVGWIERKRHSRRRRRDGAVRGLMPASVSAEHLGPMDYYFWDDFWSVRGLRDGAVLLRAAGELAAAARAEEWAAAMWSDLAGALDAARERLGSPVIPAGPDRGIDPAIIGSLVACEPLGLLAADDPAITATAEAIRQRFMVGPAFFQGISHTGLGTYLTMQLAAVELAAGDRRALDRLSWMVGAATPTFTWPEAIHPQLGGGCMGDGHHGWAAAEFLSFVRNLCVREVEGGLDLFGLMPDDWWGQSLEIHHAPTHYGLLSAALRWHGDRPALLWDLEGPNRSGTDRVRFRAPGLDGAWTSTERRGEVLLSAPSAPVGVRP